MNWERPSVSDAGLIGRLRRLDRLTPRERGTNISVGRTSLSGEALQGADLRDLDLGGVDLRNTDLRGADLRGTSFEAPANHAIPPTLLLSGAMLEGADLRGTRGLTFEMLTAAIGWERAYRDPDLAGGAPIPDPEIDLKKTLADLLRLQRELQQQRAALSGAVRSGPQRPPYSHAGPASETQIAPVITGSVALEEALQSLTKVPRPTQAAIRRAKSWANGLLRRLRSAHHATRETAEIAAAMTPTASTILAAVDRALWLIQRVP